MLRAITGAEIGDNLLTTSVFTMPAEDEEAHYEASEDAFCTGPRRSLALLPMMTRPDEPEADKRARMFKVVSAFASNQVMSGAGTKLWCSFSKTPEERAVAAHASLIKRVVAEFDADLAQNSLDFEYKTGTVWGPDGMLCSANLPVPPEHDHKNIDEIGEAPLRKWIDVGLLAKLVSKPLKKVREMVEQCRLVGGEAGGFRERGLKHMKFGSLVWVGSVHLTPGATHSQSEQEMSEFLQGMPKGIHPVVCQCDANAGIRWSVQEEQVMAVGLDGKANGVLDQLKSKQLQVISPAEEQFGVPTSRIDSLDQQVLVDLAMKCTRCVPGLSYRDPPDVKAQKGHPHTAVHNHLELVYSGDGVRPNEGVFPGSTKGFDLEELRTALGQMKTGKSVGVERNSAELLKAVADLPGGSDHLLEFMTRTLVTHEVPRDWNVPLMVILAKVGTPTEAKHLRQSSDFLYSVWRVLMLEREWHAGLGGCYGFALGEWEANEDTGCRDRRFKYEPDVAPYMFLPKMTEEMGDALVDLVSWTEECSGPPCLCVPDDRFASKSWLSQGMPGVQEGKLCVARSRLPGPDPGGCEDDRRERYPMKLGDYMFEEGYFGTKGWGFGVMCHASLSGFVRVEPGAGRQDGRRQEIDNRGARGLVGEESDVAVMMQSYSHRSTGPRPDGIPRRDFEELVADFRQLVDMGIGRRARRDLIFRVQCRQPARVLRFLQEVLGGCLDDDAALPIDWPSGKGSGKGPGALPHSDEDEPDVTGLFQGDEAGKLAWQWAHLRARVHGLRLGSYVDRDLADRVEALCVVVEEHGQEALAGGFHAMEAQVAEWTWGWWRVLEPMMVHQPEHPPVESAAIQVTSSLDTEKGLSGSLDATELAELAADQAETRKRTFLNVTVDSGEPAGSTTPSWSVPVDVLSGQRIVISFRTVVEGQAGNSGTSGSGSPDSGASTVPAGPAASSGVMPVPGGVPLEFPQFQAIYERWSQGSLSDGEVKIQYGAETLELMETQKIVMPGRDSGVETAVVTEESVMLAGGAAANLGVSASGDRSNQGQGFLAGQGFLREGPGDAVESTDTLLDEMLATCKSSTETVIESRDCGKPFAESQGDLGVCADTFDYYAQVTPKEMQPKSLALPEGDAADFVARTQPEPLGVVGCITPWNFPLMQAVLKVAPALAAGCTVVLKPSPLASLTCCALGELVAAAGAPAGALNVVTGGPPEVLPGQSSTGQSLIDHDMLDKVSFTGSGMAGQKMLEASAPRLRPTSLELGGKSAFVIFEDAGDYLDAVVDWVMVGIFQCSGQVCSATSRVLIHESLEREFVDRLLAAMRNPVGRTTSWMVFYFHVFFLFFFGWGG
ncbi:unnamed protein product [Symbiodinium sp. KB8]|nr:unnamed protein product [Symbiodinium sp. KB8]